MPNESYIENSNSSYECDENVKLEVPLRPCINEFITDDCIRTQCTKWNNFQKKYGVQISKTILEKHKCTEKYNLAKFMCWIEGGIYTPYFRVHKTEEMLELNKVAVKIEDDYVSVAFKTLNAISRRVAGIPFINNIIFKAIGFVKKNQLCVCKHEHWKMFKEFIGTEEIMEEGMYPKGGLYMLQLNCDKGTNKYKIGKAQDLLRRLRSTEYRNAHIVCTMMSKNIDKCERDLINEFNAHFINIKDSNEGGFGSEMFEGDVEQMIPLFYSVCFRWRK